MQTGNSNVERPTIVDIISRMRTLDAEFPKREKCVADYILDNLDKSAYLNQLEIAEAVGVSVATVNRFCVKLGCSGFREFKIRLAQSVAVSMQYLGEPVNDNSGSDQLVVQVFSALIDTLNLARNQLDSDVVARTIGVLSQARRICFVGVGGGSANVAREGANRFFRLGIPSESHADGYLQRMVASTFGKGDVLFAISASGQPRELLDSVAIARQYGAHTISLTKSGSSLAALTDISIMVDLPEDQDIYKPSASRLVFAAIVDVLAAGVARKRPHEVKEYLRRIRTSLVSVSNDTEPKPVGD
ncbi:MAG: MurR/RpiR family transcriptional regulator [Albidovulum sp.]|nr:MurR/RpiR family transcriptional regulator [Albidovulum sp.]MDE0531087.1 MurR/RpiR family transcriptional regulator [Albidovulum sp.]